MDSPRAKRQRVDDRCSRPYAIESMLSVPAQVIFRQEVTTTNTQSAHHRHQENRPLLTRAEADCLLKVSFLAQELDVLIHLIEQELNHKRHCRLFRKKVTESSSSSSQTTTSTTTAKMLQPLIPVLEVLEGQPTPSVRRALETLGQLLSDLAACATTLRQSSEQNWTLSESLIDVLNGLAQGGQSTKISGQSLAQEKRKLAELEEEVCQRIEKLVTMTTTAAQDEQTTSITSSELDTCRVLFQERRNDHPNAADDDSTSSTQFLLPLRSLCLGLFPDPDASIETAAPPRAQQQKGGSTNNFSFLENDASQPEFVFSGSNDAGEGGGVTGDNFHDYHNNEGVITQVGVEESQSSIRNKASAAKALAILALGKPVPQNSSSDGVADT